MCFGVVATLPNSTAERSDLNADHGDVTVKAPLAAVFTWDN